MEIQVLGPLRVLDDGDEIDVGSRKQRTLLALLAASANRVVTTDRIIDELWPGDPDGHENALWVYISRLRAALEPDHTGRTGHQVLRTADHGYTLTVEPDVVDAWRFEQMAADAGRLAAEDASGAAALLRDADLLWRGEAFEGLDAPFVLGERTRLGELRVSALEQRFDLDLRLGTRGNLVAEIEAAHLAHPYREQFVAQLMLALYRRGRQADALRTFQRFRHALADDLGVDPSPELVRLEEQVLLHDSRLRPRSHDVTTVRNPSMPTADATNPFKGLHPFGEDDAGDFFGRVRLVTDVIRRIEDGAGLVSLVGPSGSGKSSALRAGVLPALRKRAIEGSDLWPVAQMVPGARPFAELDAALARSTLDAPASMVDHLRGEHGLLGAALRLLPDERSKLVLVIDQFEELFTLAEDPETTRAFLDALIPALDDPRRRVAVLITLRADFYGAAIAHSEFGSRLGDGVVNVVPLALDELEEAATLPMQRAGCHFEPALLVSLLGDVVGQPAALPMFQYTLTELFERRSGDMLTLEAYQQLGGVHGALAKQADSLYAELRPDEQRVAQQLFLRMVTIGDGDAWTRRRVSAAEVLGLDVDVLSLQRVIHHFGDHRLLAFDRDPVSDAPTLEVAHEALLTAWPRLQEWIDEARDDVRRRSLLGIAALEWVDSGERADYLYTGSRLSEYEAWTDTSVVALTQLERRFLQAGADERDRGDEEEAERQAQLLARDKKARRRIGALAAAVLALVCVGAGVLLFAGGEDPPRVERFAPTAGGVIAQQFEEGWAQVDREFDLDVAALLQPVSDVAGQFEALVETEPDVVFIEGPIVDLEGALRTDFDVVSRRYPDQLFVTAEPSGASAPNLAYFEFASHEGSYLAGVAAATVSETGVIGFIGGTPLVVDGFRAGYEAGARSVNPDIEILSTYLLGGFFEVFTLGSDGPAVTRALLADGADVIYHATGGGGAAIRSTVAADGGAWFIGVDADESLVAAPEERPFVLTSMLKRHDLAVVEIGRRLEAGELEPGVIVGDVANGVMNLVTPGNLPADALAAVERAREAIISGQVKVPDLPASAPIDVPGTVAIVPVDPADPVCVDGPLEFARGEIVRFDIDNIGSEGEWTAIWPLLPGVAPSDVTYDRLRVDQAWGFSPATGVVVPPFSRGALTVRFDSAGTWVIECGGPFIDAGARYTAVEVLEPDVDRSETIAAVDDGRVLCMSEFDAPSAGDALRFVLDEASPELVLTVFGIDDPGIGWHPGWWAGSGARITGSSLFDPSAREVLAVLDRPGWYALECASGNDRGDLVVFEVLAP